MWTGQNNFGGGTTTTWRGSTTLHSDVLLTTPRDVWGSWQITFKGATWLTPLIATVNGARSRCDQAFADRPAGCVFSNVPGINEYSQTAVPEYTSHVDKAMTSGLPGRVDSARQLHRPVRIA
ncbi:hypothetical protein ACQPYH_28720 [Kribbella sp. CA-245084]|uniref:hypothetical protein n=1 Tax=Kribbella sp. CA-245084 TaxID=3239940 RepID=UPI003D918C00